MVYFLQSGGLSVAVRGPAQSQQEVMQSWIIENWLQYFSWETFHWLLWLSRPFEEVFYCLLFCNTFHLPIFETVYIVSRLDPHCPVVAHLYK